MRSSKLQVPSSRKTPSIKLQITPVEIKSSEWLEAQPANEANVVNPSELLESITRRHFFSRCALGLGSIALASLLNEQRVFGAALSPITNPMSPKQPRVAARAKNIIYLFMAGGP